MEASPALGKIMGGSQFQRQLVTVHRLQDTHFNTCCGKQACMPFFACSEGEKTIHTHTHPWPSRTLVGPQALAYWIVGNQGPRWPCVYAGRRPLALAHFKPPTHIHRGLNQAKRLRSLVVMLRPSRKLLYRPPSPDGRTANELKGSFSYRALLNNL